MESNENYEELKWTARSFFKFITSDKLYYIAFLLVVMVVSVKILDFVFGPILKRRNKSVQIAFLKGCLQVLIVIATFFKILTLFDFFSEFASQILMSSSLIVVVLGFVFQEGLSNIVHGFILTLFNPFRLGDRVQVTVDGEHITGYVQSIDLRHTVIKNVLTSSRVIVPNSKMDLSVIDNNYFEDSFSSNFLDLEITYESDLTRAMELITETIDTHPLVAKAKKERGIKDPTGIMVRELAPSGVSLRASVVTLTVEDNFAACSDIRRDLVLKFQKDGHVAFAYPHIQLADPS